MNYENFSVDNYYIYALVFLNSIIYFLLFTGSLFIQQIINK